MSNLKKNILAKAILLTSVPFIFLTGMSVEVQAKAAFDDSEPAKEKEIFTNSSVVENESITFGGKDIGHTLTVREINKFKISDGLHKTKTYEEFEKEIIKGEWYEGYEDDTHKRSEGDRFIDTYGALIKKYYDAVLDVHDGGITTDAVTAPELEKADKDYALMQQDGSASFDESKSGKNGAALSMSKVWTAPGFLTKGTVFRVATCDGYTEKIDTGKDKYKNDEGIAQDFVDSNEAGSKTGQTLVDPINGINKAAVTENGEGGLFGINCSSFGMMKNLGKILDPVNITNLSPVMSAVFGTQIIAMGMAVLLIAVFGVYYATGNVSEDPVRFLIRGFFVMLVVFFLPYFAQDILNINNMLLMYIGNGITDSSSEAVISSSILVSLFGVINFVMTSLGTILLFGPLSGGIVFIAAIIFIFVVIYLLKIIFTLMFWWYARFMMIMFLVVLGPLFVVMMILPQTANYGSKWLQFFLGEVFTQTFMVFGLFVVSGLLGDMGTVAGQINAGIIGQTLLVFAGITLLTRIPEMSKSLVGSQISGGLGWGDAKDMGSKVGAFAGSALMAVTNKAANDKYKGQVEKRNELNDRVERVDSDAINKMDRGELAAYKKDKTDLKNLNDKLTKGKERADGFESFNKNGTFKSKLGSLNVDEKDAEKKAKENGPRVGVGDDELSDVEGKFDNNMEAAENGYQKDMKEINNKYNNLGNKRNKEESLKNGMVNEQGKLTKKAEEMKKREIKQAERRKESKEDFAKKKLRDSVKGKLSKTGGYKNDIQRNDHAKELASKMIKKRENQVEANKEEERLFFENLNKANPKDSDDANEQRNPAENGIEEPMKELPFENNNGLGEVKPSFDTVLGNNPNVDEDNLRNYHAATENASEIRDDAVTGIGESIDMENVDSEGEVVRQNEDGGTYRQTKQQFAVEMVEASSNVSQLTEKQQNQGLNEKESAKLQESSSKMEQMVPYINKDKKESVKGLINRDVASQNNLRQVESKLSHPEYRGKATIAEVNKAKRDVNNEISANGITKDFRSQFNEGYGSEEVKKAIVKVQNNDSSRESYTATVTEAMSKTGMSQKNSQAVANQSYNGIKGVEPKVAQYDNPVQKGTNIQTNISTNDYGNTGSAKRLESNEIGGGTTPQSPPNGPNLIEKNGPPKIENINEVIDEKESNEVIDNKEINEPTKPESLKIDEVITSKNNPINEINEVKINMESIKSQGFEKRVKVEYEQAEGDTNKIQENIMKDYQGKEEDKGEMIKVIKEMVEKFTNEDSPIIDIKED